MLRATPVLFLLLSLAACNGPKDNCQDTVDSFFTLWKRHSYETMYEMLTPEHQKKARDPDAFAKIMHEFWDPTYGYSMKWNNVAESNKTCIASGEWSYTFKVRGKLPESHDEEYISWTARKGSDGLWYMELPGSEKVSGF